MLRDIDERGILKQSASRACVECPPTEIAIGTVSRRDDNGGTL
jgi:hypothetical protein